jgi:hypothetical protein
MRRTLRGFLSIPRGNGEDVLAAPGGVGLVELEVRAGARPPVAFLPDEVDVRRAVDGIDAKTFFGLAYDKRSVLGPLGAGLKLCLGNWSFSFVWN